MERLTFKPTLRNIPGYNMLEVIVVAENVNPLFLNKLCARNAVRTFGIRRFVLADKLNFVGYAETGARRIGDPLANFRHDGRFAGCHFDSDPPAINPHLFSSVRGRLLAENNKLLANHAN